MTNSIPIKFSRGESSNLPIGLNDGNIYFCIDTGNIKIDTNDKRVTLLSSDNTGTQLVDGKLKIKSSLLIGESAEAYGNNSQVQGEAIIAYGNNSHAEGLGEKETIPLIGSAGVTTYNLPNTFSVSNLKKNSIIKYNNIFAKIISLNSTNNTITLDKTLSSNEALDLTEVDIFQYGALGNYSHSEGHLTSASGIGSHAEGQGTIATTNYSHVEGIYNLEDTENKYIHIVGNGTSTNRSNAYTLDKNGNAWFAGGITLGNNQIVATQSYVNQALGIILNGES